MAHPRQPQGHGITCRWRLEAFEAGWVGVAGWGLGLGWVLPQRYGLGNSSGICLTYIFPMKHGKFGVFGWFGWVDPHVWMRFTYPDWSDYSIFTYISPIRNQTNVGKICHENGCVYVCVGGEFIDVFFWYHYRRSKVANWILQGLQLIHIEKEK